MYNVHAIGPYPYLRTEQKFWSQTMLKGHSVELEFVSVRLHTDEAAAVCTSEITNWP